MNREFVATGLLSKQASDALHKGFESRLEWDYKRPETPPAEEAAAVIERAKKFLEEVTGLVKRGAHLG